METPMQLYEKGVRFLPPHMGPSPYATLWYQLKMTAEATENIRTVVRL
jgi:hypothetical protein